MGQNTSAPVQHGGLEPTRRTPLARSPSSRHPLQPTRNIERISFQRSSAAFLTRTQISSRTNASGYLANSDGNDHEQVIYESEERPLRNMGDLRMPEAPINDISAAPLPRPRSMLARVASSIHHRYSTISVDGATTNESWNDTVTWNNRQTYQPRRTFSMRSVSRRLSVLSTIGRSSHSNNSRTATDRFSISRPIPQQNDSSLSPDFGIPDALRRAPTPGSTLDQIAEDENVVQRPLRRSRMTRFRQSISGPIDLLRNSFHGTQTQLRSSERAEQANTTDESTFLIPPTVTRAAGADMEDHIDTSEAPEHPGETRQDDLAELPATESVSTSRAYPISNEFAAQSARRPRYGPGAPRNFPSVLRARSSRMIRRDDEMPLSTILQLAATAIAAQLSGSTDALTNLESVGDDQLDGNLNTFVEELNNAPGAPGSARDANTPPLNFWRVYRFDNGSENRSSLSSALTDDPRTVTVVVVGVRSVSSSTATMRDNITMGTGLDTLLDLPRLRHSSLTRPDRRHYHRMSRRHLSGNHNPASFADLRSNREIADIVDFGPPAWNSPHSESPPGPYPPPSTPAERLSLSPIGPQSSLLAAGTEPPRLSLSSWIRRRSALTSSPPQQDNDMDDASSSEDASPSTNQPQTPVRRRRSDSEAARHPHLHRDDPRRHGIIGAPHDREDAAPLGRSWLIYVIGTNLSEDNPLLDMPDLFDINVCCNGNGVSLLILDREILTKTCFDSKSLSDLLNLPRQQRRIFVLPEEFL